MSEDLTKITKNSNGFYTWSCSMDVGYYRKGMWMGIKACLGIAAFILVFGVIMAIQFHDWTNRHHEIHKTWQFRTERVPHLHGMHGIRRFRQGSAQLDPG